MEADEVEPAAEPEVRFSDHLAVVWLIVVSLFQGLVTAVFIPFGVFMGPLTRAWMKRLLEKTDEPPLADPDVVSVADGTKVFVIAGEASGDRLAARVIRSMREQAPGIDVVGYGSRECRAAGMRVLVDLTEHAVMGVVAVIGSLGYWWRVCVETRARFRSERPDLLLTVDFPGLNVCLARWARLMGIRTVHLVAPQLWAHAPWRVVRWRRAVDRLLCTLPFEQRWFSTSRIPTTFVGHPLFESPLEEPRTSERRPADGRAIVEVLPGSRRREIHGNLAMLLDAASRIRSQLPDVDFEVRLAESKHEDWYRAADSEFRNPSHPEFGIRVGPPRSETALLGSLATSGTVTAELAVDLVPLVTYYRIRPYAWVGWWCAITTPWFCLANLVAGREVVPEHLYTRASVAERVANDFVRLVRDGESWQATRASLEIVRRRLASARVAERTAACVLSMIPAR